MKVHGSLEVKAINTVGLRVNEGLNAQTLLNDVQLDKYAKKNQYYYVQQDRIITLPNATTIPTGWTISFYSNELSEGVIYLHDVSGTEQYKVRPKRSVSIILLDNSTAAGVWKVIESGAGGVGSRNVVITTDADQLFEVSGGTITLHPFVATISDGFEEDGVAVEEIIEFREGTAISAPTTFPSTKYIYVSLEALILEETSKQTGGNLFPKTPEQNEIFYNKIERRNYKYIDGEWTPYPCVAVGEITWTSENHAVATVYPFNEWWWDDKYGDVRNTVVISSGTVIKSNATEGPNIALAANGISSGEYGNLPIYLQQGFDGIVDTDHMWWSLQTGENVNGTAYLGNINLNEKVTTIKLYQAPYESSYVTSVIVQYSSDNGQSWANLQTYELTMPSAFGEASTLVLPDYTPPASYGLRVLANSGVSNPNAAWQIAELELLTAASGNTVEVGNFVATVSDGYDANGLPIDYVVSLPYTQTVNFTEGQAAYIYVDQYGQVFVDAHKQDGGEELPAINDDYPEGSLFYSIIQGRNYKVVNGAWVESPCVAVGEVAADGTVKVYDFNDWWWRYYDAENVLAHSFFYQNDDEYTTQITLDQVAPSKDVLSVIVSNTLLFSDMYELSGDGLTVTFLSAIEPGTPIEVRWYLPLGTITVDTTGANKDLSNLSEIGQNKLIPLDGQPGYICTRTETGVRWMPPVGISIGTVFMSDLKYPYVPEGALEYNGTEVLNADTKYPDFWTNWLTAGRMNTGTYEEYESALTTNGGTCPFYAVDLETKSFKTPIWNDGVFPSSAVTESEMDSYKAAGLPGVPSGGSISTVGSSEAWSPLPTTVQDHTNTEGYKLSVGVYESTDSSLHYVSGEGGAAVSDIYGNSDTVQPVSVRKRWFVQVANSITTFSGKNIDEIAESALEASQSAADSAALAQEWAVKMDGAVADGEYSAKYHAQQAAASATEAEGSASTAATQAANAAGSAELAQKWAVQTDSEVAENQGYGAKKYAQDAAQSAIDAAKSAASSHGLQIGAVYFSQSSLATDNPGGLPLWTGEYFSNASSLYPDFYAWVKSHTELYKTKTEYDSAISTYGECPYYVVDEVAGSLRLPKLVNYLKMANATDGITQAQAGLPNITGTFSTGASFNNSTGAFTKAGGAGAGGYEEWDRQIIHTLDASRSSKVYGKSSTVTPAHTTVYPWVYAFNSAVSASEAQAAEFTQSLTQKADKDLSNVSDSGQKRAGAWALPDYSAGVSMGSGVKKAPADGWVSAYVTGPNDGRARGIRVGTSSSPNIEIYRVGGYGINTIYTRVLFPVKKDWYYGPTDGCTVESATFFPL